MRRSGRETMEEFSLKFNRMLSRVVNPPGLRFRAGDVEFLIVACHQALRPAGFEVPEHEHPYFGVALMEAGSMETFCDGRRIVCDSGSNTLFFMPQATLHSCRFSPAANNQNLSINFQISGPGAAKLSARLTDKAADCGYQVPLTPGMAALLREIRRQGNEESTSAATILRHLLPVFPALFLQHSFPGIFEEQNGEELIRTTLRQDRVGTMKRMLSAMVRDRNPAEIIARQFGLSVRHVNRIFRQETGMTIKAYQTELRLSGARNLLINSNLSIAEAAEAVGFHRPGLFSTFFHDHFGCTPQEFRARENCFIPIPPETDPD